jgi:hypothetical protein
LYGLLGALRAKDEPIFVVEGEKCAAALHGLGFAAVSSLGGSNAPRLSDWTVLQNYRGPIYFLPDNDEPGEKYAAAVAEIIKNPNLRLARLPDLPPKGDIVDWLKKLNPTWNGYQPLNSLVAPEVVEANRKALLEACQITSRLRTTGDFGDLAINTAEPIPLISPASSPQPFPLEALGAHLRPATEAIHDIVKAPLTICAQSVLAAATLAVQAHADVKLPNGQTRPISNFFLSLADSGERKTTCDNEALKPIRAREKELEQERKSQLPFWENKRDSYEQGRKMALNVKDPIKRMAEISLLGEPPQAPLQSLLTCPEPTFEGLCRLLAEGQPSMGIFSSEGGQFFGGNGMMEENRLRNITGYSGLWDGTSLRMVRKGDGVTVLDGRRLSVHLMIQPEVAAPFLADELFQQQGFFSRFLIAAPSSTMGTRFFQTPKAECLQAVEIYRDRLLGILRFQMPLAAGTQNELKPRELPLSEAAKNLWIAFHDECERGLAQGGEYFDIRGFANKLPEHSLRLAGVLALVENLQANSIDVEAMTGGISLARYYAGEALRLIENRLTDTNTQLAEAVRVWLIERWGEDFISIPDLQNRGPRRVRNAEICKKVVALLAQHNWLAPVIGETIIAGKPRKQAWKIVRPQSQNRNNRQEGFGQ